jgi:hypothetical protein
MPKRYILLFILGFLLLPLLFLLPGKIAPKNVASVAQSGTPGRVQIANLKGYGKTIVTDQNKLLRGGAAWIFKYARQINLLGYTRESAYWQKMQENGINAVRIIAFDPWQRSEGYIAMKLIGENAKDRDEISQDTKDFLDHLDAVVDLAAQYGMYAVINYHDVGKYQDCQPRNPQQAGKDIVCQTTLKYITEFWNLVAPRYKNRPHVLYEIANEPVSDRNGGNWFPSDVRLDPYLKDQKTLYDLIRSQAPDTHIIMLSFANTTTFGNPRTMKVVADDLNQLGIDWSNTSIGFHPYATGGSSKDIRDLMASYPVVNTEGNFPPKVTIQDPDPQKTESMDGELFGVQTMERLGISWFNWKIDGYEHFQNNYVGVLKKDAQQKGYFWN